MTQEERELRAEYKSQKRIDFLIKRSPRRIFLCITRGLNLMDKTHYRYKNVKKN